jgi:RNA polymerase sigma-70 factor (ECF subfamily)
MASDSRSSDDENIATTQWSLVVRAGNKGDSQSHEAISELCQRYWLPVYAFLRRQVQDVHEAQDLTQGFFAHLLEKSIVTRANPDRGRFRSFLLASAKNFVANQRARARAQKRGGSAVRLSLDFENGEGQLTIEPGDETKPEVTFDRQWALSLIHHAMQRIEEEFVQADRCTQFRLLKGALMGETPEFSYAEIGRQLGLSEDAARQAGQRLRRRFRQVLREEVSQTLSDPADVDDEIRNLFVVLGR